MKTRGQKRLAEEADTFAPKKRKCEEMPQNLKSTIKALPDQLLRMIFNHLEVEPLRNLCYVSHRYKEMAQPLIFENLDWGLYDQRGLWTRLELLADAYTNANSYSVDRMR
ncbi:uncharacterized protein N7477_007214 [Penicillium maclennaniae]|uniref:uncharacterized protein n=1 Tax=Penicillium maclennaniae TaxID=1343394 RepID=UPI0025407F70|nr:uncharacterized protein N7477_007214 [Penicillium maclennaniae]KAJ5668644.1 hypothetical protein N7477_007214 [Penicillium maclennaniae]